MGRSSGLGALATVFKPFGVLVLLLVLGSALVAVGELRQSRSPAPLPLDAPPPPTAEDEDTAWPVTREWNAEAELGFSRLASRLGAAVRDGRCARFADCLRDSSVNPGWDERTDSEFAVRVDCADLPYVLRAYFAFKSQLPFGWVSAVTSASDDPAADRRYLRSTTAIEWSWQSDFSDIESLVQRLRHSVHSGMLRTAPEAPDTDFYPVRVNAQSISPGAVFYDPGGHVMIVAEVGGDGSVHFVDAHPDGSLTWTRFADTLPPFERALGGGFKRFRPIRTSSVDSDDPERALRRLPNDALADFDGESQWSSAAWRVRGRPASYHAWVRASLAQPGSVSNAATELREEVEAVCRELQDRARAVDAAVNAGLTEVPHPPALPDNIYGADDAWEAYSTPGRDARLRALFLEMRRTVAAADKRQRAALRQTWLDATSPDHCPIDYSNSEGTRTPLSMNDVIDRLFALSFDPYHCPERRWGEPLRGAKRKSCRESPEAARWYAAEQRLRYRLDRGTGGPTPLDSGPPRAPLVDPRPLLGARRG